MLHQVLAGLSAILVLTAGSITASGQEYCVSCTEPAAVYRCSLDVNSPPGNKSLQMLCITTLAKDGGHASCGVRGGTVFECNGPLKRVTIAPDAAIDSGGKVAPSARKEAGIVAEPKLPAVEPGEPKTVEQLARQLATSSSEQAKKTGDAVKSGTRRTWDCLTSFFKTC